MLKRLFFTGSLLFCILCVGLKFWPSDRWPLVAVFVYVPPVLLFLWMLLQVAIFRKHRIIHLALIASLLVFTFWKEFRYSYTYDTPIRSIRIFHWNVWNIRMGVEEIVKTIAEQNPDIICLNEPKSSRNAPAYPSYPDLLRPLTHSNWTMFTGNYMAILSKHPMEAKKFRGRSHQGLYARIETPNPVSVVLLDVVPEVTESRWFAFSDIHREISHFQPDVIAGDFNTPAHARSIQKILQDYKDPRRGINYTWPVYFPMMRIDYILVKPEVAVVHHENHFTLASDHAWQIVDLKP